MNNRLIAPLALLGLIPAVALALTIAPGNLYTDVRTNSPEAAGINMLTREGIVKGYGNGFFGVARSINRAEFLKIAYESSGESQGSGSKNCFPDVREGMWFHDYVCAAKDLSVVKGMGDGKFHPELTVTYGEALKILDRLFGYDVLSGNDSHWAEGYYQAALERSVDLPVTIDLDTPLTRGLSARLAAAYLAESQGKLAELRLAESGQYSSSSSSYQFCGGIAAFQCSGNLECIDDPRDSCDPMRGGADCGGICVAPSSASSSSRSSSSSTSSVSSSAGPVDSKSDTSAVTQFILLGETTPVLGSSKVFLEAEPLAVTEIQVSLTLENPTVNAILIYDDTRHLLGRANLDPSASSNRVYKLNVPSGAFSLAQKQERRIYVRADLRSKDGGGQTNQLVQISNVVVKGNGVWSSTQYTSVSASNEVFPMFRTARSTITSIVNAGPVKAGLVTGTQMVVGSFTFTGRKTDATAHIDLTALTFDLQLNGGASVSNVMLLADGLNEKFPCTSTTVQITCSAIPSTYGSLTDGPRTLILYADVAASDPAHAGLRVTLNDPGTATTAGSVTWTDNASTYTWVALPSPLADSTLFQY